MSLLLPISLTAPLPMDQVAHLVRAFLTPVALVWLASWVALYAHEIGHAAAARLLGVRIWGVQLGIGPALIDRVVAGCRLRIGLLPLVGSVALVDADAAAIGYRDIGPRWRFEWVRGAWRAPVISAAGGVSNLLTALLVAGYWVWFGRPAFGTLAGDLCLYTFITNLSGYFNLLPWFSSDGRHLVEHISAARRRPAARPSLG